MSEHDPDVLQEELDSFLKEKIKIRNVVGKIGGGKSAKRDTLITIAFVIALIIIFLFDILGKQFGLSADLPLLFSIELGVLLVSVKIIWMIHKQTKVEHFQFWILNSIEFRLNDMARRLVQIERMLKEKESAS